MLNFTFTSLPCTVCNGSCLSILWPFTRLYPLARASCGVSSTMSGTPLRASRSTRSASSRSARSFSSSALRRAAASSAIRLRSASAAILLRLAVPAIFCQASKSCLAASIAALRSFSEAIFSAMELPPFDLAFSNFFKASSLSATIPSATVCAISSSPSVCSTMASQAVSLSACSYSGFPCSSFGILCMAGIF